MSGARPLVKKGLSNLSNAYTYQQRDVLITLDALGTLYRFRDPIAKQYLSVANECGLKTNLTEDALMRSFKQAYRSLSARSPNYGKDVPGHAGIASPREWWTSLITSTFNDLVPERDFSASLANKLGNKLFDHFSGSAAYKLFEDVDPFLARIRNVREYYRGRRGPKVIVGVVSNSDPRVRSVLQSLHVNANIDASQQKSMLDENWKKDQGPASFAPTGIPNSEPIDFVLTSYDIGYEKPNVECWKAVEAQASRIRHARSQVLSKDDSASLPPSRDSHAGNHAPSSAKFNASDHNWIWFHIGDDHTKDIAGSTEVGINALHLVRERHEQADAKGEVFGSLSEAADAIEFVIGRI